MAEKEDFKATGSPPPEYGNAEPLTSGNLFQRFVQGFERHPNAHVTAKGTVGADGKVFDAEEGNAAVAESPLARKLKGRHIQMIAIGGSIGTGLFVGSGGALATGGPASLLIAFTLIGMMLYCVVHALGELAVLYPVAGSFAAYSTRFIDPAWGFAMGWNYAMQWLIVLPLEIVAAAITVEYWQSPVNPAVWCTLFWLLIVSINLFGVKGYGEAEFVFSLIKVIAVIGFM
jgi:yeast amino acid transporter